MFTKSGDIKVRITSTMLAEPKFETAGPNGFDVCLQVQDITDANQSDWWRGEISPNFGKGTFSDRTQAQITLATLEKVGFQGGNDLSRLNELVGVETTAHVEASSDGKYHNIKWIGTGGAAPKQIDTATAAARFKALMANPGAVAPVTTTPPVSTAPAAAAKPKTVPNPFA